MKYREVKAVDIINKQYLILRNITSNNIVSSYVVEDIINNNTVQLKLLNADYTPAECTRFLINNFIEYSNIDSSSITKVIDFGLVKTINEQKIGYKQYYYTTEHFEKVLKIKDIIRVLSRESLINIFIEICAGVQYLHLRGMVYENIDLDNIFVLNINGKYRVKLNDLISVQINKDFLKEGSIENFMFKAPEIINGTRANKASDLYSLGVLLYILLLLSYGIDVDLSKDIHRSIKEKSIKINSSVMKVINKMTSLEEYSRYEDVNKAVKDLNEVLGKNYSCNKKEDIEKLSFNNKLVDRDYEVNKIISTYNQMKNKASQNKLILVHGERGTGKTKLLKEIERLIYLDGGNVYSAYNLEKSNSANRGFSEIAKMLIESCTPEILEHYESELIKFVPEIGNNKQITPTQPLIAEKEKLRLLKVGENFLREICENSLAVFIIDNIHMASKFSVELIEYLYSSNLNSKNIMFIISYCDEEALFDKEFSEFISKEKNNPNTINIGLKELSQEGTIELIKNIMNLNKAAANFSKRIHEQTYGNPLFIEETLKIFLLNKVIYVDENTGRWYSDYEGNYEKLPIPRSLEQACINQISKLDNDAYLIAEFISVFNNGISKEIIEKFLCEYNLECDSIIKSLCTRGIMCRKIEDRGFVYDFSSKLLKDIVYKKIDSDKRSNIHNWVANIFESEYEEDKYYEEEIIYHLEKSGQNHKVIRYCIDSSEKMLKLRNREGALLNLKKAVSLLDHGDYTLRIELLLKISQLYEDDANYSLSINYGKKAKKLCIKLRDKKLLIDAYNTLASVYLKSEDLNKSIESVEAAERLLGNINHEEGYIKNRYILSRICLGRDENERVISICKDAIELCGKEYLKYKAMLYNTLGTAYMELNRAEESIKNYKESYKCSKSINYGEGLVLALNNLAVVYGDYYQREDKTEEYLLNAKEICENDKLIYYEVLALVNLGEVYLGKYDYEKSLKYFLEGLRKSKEINFEKIIFYSLNQLSMAYFRLNDYEMAYRYYILSEEEYKNYKKQVREEADFYRLQGEFLFNIGSIEKARKYLEESLRIYNDQEFTLKWKNEIQLQHVNLIEENNFEKIKSYIEKIEMILSNFKEENKRFEVIYDTVLILYKKGKKDLALSLFNKYKFNLKDSTHLRINIRYMHVNSILAQDEEKFELLYSVLQISNRLKEYKIKYELCIELGKWHLSRENYIRAANYYFEACKEIRCLLSKLPESIKEEYIKVNNLYEPFYKLINIRNHYMDSKVECTEVNSAEELLEFKYSIDMLKEEAFVEEARTLYSKYYHNMARNELDIINNLTSDSMANLEIILRYLSWITLATRGKILLEGENEKYVTLVSLQEDLNDAESTDILKKVRNTKAPILLKYPYASKEEMAIICIPIIMKSLKGMAIEGKKKNRRGYGIVKGYIYLSSDKILNNFNNDSLRKCMNLTNLTDYILEKYQLKVNSSLDTLTGALTRQYLENELEDLIEESIENKGLFSLIMFDLDNFKNINDSYGHQIGDEILKKVSAVILENVRSQDICGRYGGEEFVILLPNVDKNEAKKVSDRLRRKIKKKVILGDNTPVTISMGIASYPEHGYLKYELIEKADHALYVAKELGKDRCEVWQREFGSDIKHGNKLSGIVSGNLVKDSRNVSAIIELINVMNEDLNIEKKVYKSLGEIMSVVSAKYASIIYLENNEIKERFKRKINEETWCSEKIYNDKIVEDVITQKQGICTIYWDEELEYDLINEVSEWYSVMASPVMKNDSIQYIIYVAVPLKSKRFNHKDLNFFNTMCKIIRLM